MKVDPVLNWKPWKFDRGAGPIEFRVRGNPDTAVGIKFFLYLNNPDKADEEAIRDEFEPYSVDPARMTGTVNRLGFIFIARPVLSSGKDLFVLIEARQGVAGAGHQQDYGYTLEGAETFFKMSDGATLVF